MPRAAILGVILAVLGISWPAGVVPPARAADAEALTGGTSAEDPAAIEEGKRLFTLSCSNEFCHGPGGVGKMFGPPNAQKLTDDKWYYADGTYPEVIRIIKEGIVGSPMEPWEGRLGMERIRQVAAYVISLSRKK
jgi:mono/diheme cytochrome c family protein